MSDIPFDEPNDNFPCPECGQDDCVCTIFDDFDDDEDFYDDPDDVGQVEEEEDES